ncbi:MAG TPA: hypothetical protein VMV81_07935 [Phycisphaerae bacterium]|nr:hypothetical protein [Phycisphaerae bacterium]
MSRFFGLALFSILATVPRAFAQIDHRVNQGNATTAGYALDKNNQVGSGGFNLSRPTGNGFDAGFTSNAIVTGNVSGLAGFHWPTAPVTNPYMTNINRYSTTNNPALTNPSLTLLNSLNNQNLTPQNPYISSMTQTSYQNSGYNPGYSSGIGGVYGPSPVMQSNQFRTDLPSTSLSGFSGRSVGLNQVMSNSNSPYYSDPTRTIATAGQIQQGLNMPGSSQLDSTTATPPFQTLATPPQYSPNVRDPADTRSQLDAPATPYGIRSVAFGAHQKKPTRADSVAPAFRAASESPIFGTALPETNLPELPPDFRTDQILGGPTWDELAKAQRNSRLPSGAATIEKPPTGALEQEAVDTAGIKTQKEPTEKNVPTIAPGQPLPMNGAEPANLGADRFADLYSAVRAADQVGVQKIGLQPTTPNEAEQPANERGRSQLIRKPSEGLTQLGTAAKWAKEMLENPVTSFVGRNADRLNAAMASGEEAMRQGEYYKASRYFAMAGSIDVLNPLPYLNRGHALAAAGDYLSAVRSLEQGIRLFPQIAAFKLDLVALVGQRDIFDVRRADLETRLAAREQYELRFLLGYLELYSGLAEEGMKNLRSAAKEAPVDSPIAGFADLVAGERPLPSLNK